LRLSHRTVCEFVRVRHRATHSANWPGLKRNPESKHPLQLALASLLLR
jgi:hypothetical protein